jgi:hypothetical protein
MHYRLRQVELGRRPSDDKPVTSCVVEPVDAPPAATDKKRKLADGPRRALELLIDTVARHGTVPPGNNYIPPGTPCVTEKDWRLRFYGAQVSSSDKQSAKQKSFVRAAEALLAGNYVGKEGEWVWPVKPA